MNNGQTEHLSGNSITAVIDHGIFLWQLMWSSGGSDPWPLDSDQFPVHRGNCIYIAPFKTLVNKYFKERREVGSGTQKVIYISSRIKCAVHIIMGITLSTSWQLQHFTPGNDMHLKLPLWLALTCRGLNANKHFHHWDKQTEWRRLCVTLIVIHYLLSFS